MLRGLLVNIGLGLQTPRQCIVVKAEGVEGAIYLVRLLVDFVTNSILGS